MRRTERLRMTVVTAFSAVLYLGWPAIADRSSCGQDSGVATSRTLLSQMSWLRVDVVSGRFEPRGFRAANVRILQSRDLPNGDSEELQFINDAGKASLRFEHRSGTWRRTVFLDDQGKVVLRHESNDPANGSFEYEQTAGRPLRIVASRASDSHEYRATSIWHFAFEQPELASDSLEPLIQLVRPSWSLMREAEAVREALTRTAGRTPLPDKGEVERYVRQLASGRFAERKAADRWLREQGPSVLSLLDQLDPTTFDREQRERLRGIKEVLGLSGPDSPQLVAQRLAADPLIWTALLNSESAEQRRLAVARLEEMTGRSTGFDPDAAPPVRAARREALLKSRSWK